MVCSILLASMAQAAVPVTTSFDMEENGIAYRIFTIVPGDPAPEHGYPVIYMTDGNRMAPIAEKILKEDESLKAVIVGIGYPTEDRDEIVRLRYFDLTPKTSADLIPGHFNVPKTGGRDAFFSFLDEKVKPQIESRFRIDTMRQALFGHSLGGLFTLYTLFNHTSSFQAYSAADPSVWWNNHSILEDKQRFLAEFQSDPHPIRLLIETSGKHAIRPEQTKEETERLNKLRGGPSGVELFEEFSMLPQLDAAYRRFDNESHGSMIPLTVKDSLKFLLHGLSPAVGNQ